MRLRRSQPFSMLEMVAALVILGVVLSTYVQLVRTLGQAQRGFAQESQALTVLTNTIEQLAAQPTITVADARAALDRQWAAARFAGQDALVPSVTSTPAGVVLAVRRQKSTQNLVQVVIPHAPAAR